MFNIFVRVNNQRLRSLPRSANDSEIFPTSLRAVGKYCTIGKQEIISDHYILWSFSGRKYFLIRRRGVAIAQGNDE